VAAKEEPLSRGSIDADNVVDGVFPSIICQERVPASEETLIISRMGINVDNAIDSVFQKHNVFFRDFLKDERRVIDYVCTPHMTGKSENPMNNLNVNGRMDSNLYRSDRITNAYRQCCEAFLAHSGDAPSGEEMPSCLETSGAATFSLHMNAWRSMESEHYHVNVDWHSVAAEMHRRQRENLVYIYIMARGQNGPYHYVLQMNQHPFVFYDTPLCLVG